MAYDSIQIGESNTAELMVFRMDIIRMNVKTENGVQRLPRVTVLYHTIPNALTLQYRTLSPYNTECSHLVVRSSYIISPLLT